MVRSLLTSFRCFFLLVVADVATVRLRIFNLLSVMLPLYQSACRDSVTTLVGHLVRVICIIGLLTGLIVNLCSVGALYLSLFLFRVQAEARVINPLKEKVDVAERLEVDNDFHDGAQRHYCSANEKRVIR